MKSVEQQTVPVDLPVDVEYGAHGLVYVSSPVAKGLLVSGPTKEAAVAKVNDALRDLAAAKREQDGTM